MNQSPNYRRIVLRLTDEALRSFGGAECTREVAAQLLEVWPGRVLLNDELRAEVLAGFVAEPPSVPGQDFLPAVEADAAVLVAEAVAALDEPTPRVWDDSVPPGGWVCGVCRTPVESEPCELHGVKP